MKKDHIHIHIGRFHFKTGINVIMDDFAQGPPVKFFISLGWYPSWSWRKEWS